MTIFLSYGHDEYDIFAKRLKKDLEAKGFHVWMDTDQIAGTADWEKTIESGITGSDWFVIMMTQHSCRRPDGVCLDEVSYARFLGKSIAPIMIESVRPPLCIARIQYIDMENYFQPGQVKFDEESYQKQFQKLLNVLRGAEEINREGDYEILRSRLVPLDNDVYYEHFRHNFYGREKLFRYYRKWVDGTSRLLWLVGDAGVGKTAFIAKLTENNEEIKAVHFCRYNDSDRADPKRAIMSLAYYLSTQLEEYKDILMNLHDLDALQEKSVDRLFSYLLAEPLNRVRNAPECCVIVIDALDEATQDGRNELADVLSSRCRTLPGWVKVMVTSREDPLLRRKLSGIRAVRFEDEEVTDNQEDIRGYFDMRLSGLRIDDRDRVIQALAERSSGNFLYAKTVTEDILSGNLSASDCTQFPDGLTGIYASYFDRLCRNGKPDYRRDIRPVLELLCAEYSPLRSETLMTILDMDDYDFDDIHDEIAQMFPEKNGVMEPVHKSLVDWLTDRGRAGFYRVSPRKGHRKLAEYCLSGIRRQHAGEYAVKYAVRHLIRAQMYEEAVEVLNSEELQDSRIRLIGLDSAFREYLREIGSLSDVIDPGAEIYTKPAFLHYFTLYRKFLYNTGLYFTLKESRFDDVLDNEKLTADTDTAVGIANYLYITERFERAAGLIGKLLEDSDSLSPDVTVELNNVIALCYRKFVAFDRAEDHFRTALNYPDAPDDEYDRSISAINLGKIAYHELNWKDASGWNDLALSLLSSAYSKTDNEDEKTSILLFIAEYHRLIAECLIWNLDVAHAESHLKEAEQIYQNVTSRDRYYVRFLYTSALVSIFGNNIQSGLSLCDKADELATSQYDKSQISFYRSIALLSLGRKEEALCSAADGMRNAEQIGAWLETEELSLAKSLAMDAESFEHTERYSENPYIHAWSDYACDVLKKVTA